jgi:hypothetical protein
MGSLRQSLTAIAGLMIVAAFIAATVVGMTYVIAFVAPVVGFLYAAWRATLARRYWSSHGRLALPQEGIRIIGAGRARWLALFELLNGVGGLVMSTTLPALLLGDFRLVVSSFAIGVVLLVTTASGLRRVASGAQPIDILPPE